MTTATRGKVFSMFQKPRILTALWIWFIGEATIRFSGQSKTSPARGQVEGESGFNATQNHFDNSSWRSKLRAALDGVLAQLVEHHNGIVGVKGSNPLGSTISNIVQKRLTCSGWPE